MRDLCPICQKDEEARFRPFCSKRCADIDLGRWLKGSYIIAGDEGANLTREIKSGRKINEK